MKKLFYKLSCVAVLSLIVICTTSCSLFKNYTNSNEEISSSSSLLGDEYSDLYSDSFSENTQSTTEIVKNALSLKYGYNFEVLKMGGRIDTDSTSFYLYPDFAPDIVFKAVVDSETKEVSENFISRVISAKFNSELKDKLNEYGISGEASATFIKSDDSQENDIYISTAEYFDKYEVSCVFLYFVLNSQTLNDSSAENLISVFRTLGSKYNVQVAVSGVAVSAKYNECAEQMKLEPDVSATWFDSFSPECSYSFAVTYGISNISVSELQEILTGK